MLEEPKAMREIHQIMENLFESDRNKTPQEILHNIHRGASGLIKEKGIKLEIVKKESSVSA